MFVWVCGGDLRAKGGGGGGGEWVIWSRGKWKPSFRPRDLSRKRWLLWERFGSLAAVSGNMEREEEGRGGRRGGIKRQSWEWYRDNEGCMEKDEGQSRSKMEEGWKATQRHIGGNIQPDVEKLNEWELIPAIPAFCFLWSLPASGPRVSSGPARSWNLQFSGPAS